MDTKFCIAMSSLIALISVQFVEGIRCYHCTVHPPASKNEIPRLCRKFNETTLFEKDCIYSNYCMKKTISYPLKNSKDVVITVRDCAHQKDAHLVEKYGQSQWEPRIGDEVNEEGCSWEDKIQTSRATSTEFCYCKSHLCNGNSNSQHTDVMAVILVYNAMKYVRSFQQ